MNKHVKSSNSKNFVIIIKNLTNITARELSDKFKIALNNLCNILCIEIPQDKIFNVDSTFIVACSFKERYVLQKYELNFLKDFEIFTVYKFLSKYDKNNKKLLKSKSYPFPIIVEYLRNLCETHKLTNTYLDENLLAISPQNIKDDFANATAEKMLTSKNWDEFLEWYKSVNLKELPNNVFNLKRSFELLNKNNNNCILNETSPCVKPLELFRNNLETQDFAYKIAQYVLTDHNLNLAILGKSGIGKTLLTASLLSKFILEIQKDIMIFIITRVEQLKSCKLTNNSILLFDDCGDLQNKNFVEDLKTLVRRKDIGRSIGARYFDIDIPEDCKIIFILNKDKSQTFLNMLKNDLAISRRISILEVNNKICIDEFYQKIESGANLNDFIDSIKNTNINLANFYNREIKNSTIKTFLYFSNENKLNFEKYKIGLPNQFPTDEEEKAIWLNLQKYIE